MRTTFSEHEMGGVEQPVNGGGGEVLGMIVSNPPGSGTRSLAWIWAASWAFVVFVAIPDLQGDVRDR